MENRRLPNYHYTCIAYAMGGLFLLTLAILGYFIGELWRIRNTSTPVESITQESTITMSEI